jgi:hypothetical protein
VSGPWIPFLIAVGVVSAICYRLPNRRPGRRWPCDTGGGDVSYSSDSGSSNWSSGDWFSSSSSSDSWDSGGGGDGGGGGGSGD